MSSGAPGLYIPLPVAGGAARLARAALQSQRCGLTLPDCAGPPANPLGSWEEKQGPLPLAGLQSLRPAAFLLSGWLERMDSGPEARLDPWSSPRRKLGLSGSGASLPEIPAFAGMTKTGGSGHPFLPCLISALRPNCGRSPHHVRIPKADCQERSAALQFSPGAYPALISLGEPMIMSEVIDVTCASVPRTSV